MKIPIGKNRVIIIDDEDYELIKPYSWHLSHGHGDTMYAITAIPLHRFILNAPSGYEVDHINRNGLDNRRKNLRVVLKHDNLWNCKRRIDNSSGYTGISLDRTFRPGEIWYRPVVTYNKKRYLLCRYKNKRDALAARTLKIQELQKKGIMPKYIESKMKLTQEINTDYLRRIRYASRIARKDSKSKITGVTWDAQTQKWRATITVIGKMENLGRYAKIEDAIAARKKAEEELFKK